MSLIDTLAPVLLVVVLGILALIVVGSWAYKLVADSRAKMLTQKRYSRLEREAYQFLGKLYIETNSTTSDVTLSIELSDDLFKLVDQIDQQKELHR